MNIVVSRLEYRPTLIDIEKISKVSHYIIGKYVAGSVITLVSGQEIIVYEHPEEVKRKIKEDTKCQI